MFYGGFVNRTDKKENLSTQTARAAVISCGQTVE